MSNASEAGEGTTDGAQEQVLVAAERVLGDNEGTVERDVDSLRKFG